MDNKNIVFNHTLEQYNKKYRNRGHRLLKFTKKEVEQFDKLNKSTEHNFLLKNRKWWLIKDTYYEIPKAPRYTWFRNLNSAVQVGCCLLGAGVIATAVTVPLVLMNQNKVEEPSITIQGADFDKAESHIELNKQSTIKLIEQSGKTITGVEYVKVGDKTLSKNIEYSYDESTKVVTIKAEAMTSTKIEIKVKTKNPHIVDLETWIEKANKLNADFLSSTLEYTLDQVTKYVEKGEEKKLISVKYINKSGEGRKFWVYFLDEEQKEEGTVVANSSYSGNQLFDDGYITNNGICEIYDDEIVYKNQNAGEDEYKELHINKFGYPTYELWGDGTFYEIKYNSEPTEPEPEVEEHELSFIENGTYYIPDINNNPESVQLKSGTSYKFYLTIDENDEDKIVFFIDYNSVPETTANYINNVKAKINSDKFENFVLLDKEEGAESFGIYFYGLDDILKAGDVFAITFDVIQNIEIKPYCTIGF